MCLVGAKIADLYIHKLSIVVRNYIIAFSEKACTDFFTLTLCVCVLLLCHLVFQVFSTQFDKKFYNHGEIDTKFNHYYYSNILQYILFYYLAIINTYISVVWCNNI